MAQDIKAGDVVGRISYNSDVYFKVVEVFTGKDGKKYARLKGLDMRLEATSFLEDLKKIDVTDVSRYLHQGILRTHEKMRNVFKRRSMDRQISVERAIRGNTSEVESFDLPGSLVHLDGDKDYLDVCMTTYKQLSINANGYHVEEAKQANVVTDILQQHRPDMLVLTGHDGLLKGAKDYLDIKNYHNTKHFINAVQAARRYEKSKDDLVIFAGACQSFYEALLAAGANFASSPKRVLINAFDPVFVMEKVAYTSIYDPISLKDVISGTVTGFDGIGGIETRGKYRLGVPKSLY